MMLHGSNYGKRRGTASRVVPISLGVLVIGVLTLGWAWWTCRGHLHKTLEELHSAHRQLDSMRLDISSLKARLTSRTSELEHVQVSLHNTQQRLTDALIKHQHTDTEYQAVANQVAALQQDKDDMEARESHANAMMEWYKSEAEAKGAEATYSLNYIETLRKTIGEMSRAHAERENDWHTLANKWRADELDLQKEVEKLVAELAKPASEPHTEYKPQPHTLPPEEPQVRDETRFNTELPKFDETMVHHAPKPQPAPVPPHYPAVHPNEHIQDPRLPNPHHHATLGNAGSSTGGSTGGTYGSTAGGGTAPVGVHVEKEDFNAHRHAAEHAAHVQPPAAPGSGGHAPPGDMHGRDTHGRDLHHDDRGHKQPEGPQHHGERHDGGHEDHGGHKDVHHDTFDHYQAFDPLDDAWINDGLAGDHHYDAHDWQHWDDEWNHPERHWDHDPVPNHNEVGHEWDPNRDHDEPRHDNNAHHDKNAHHDNNAHGRQDDHHGQHDNNAHGWQDDRHGQHDARRDEHHDARRDDHHGGTPGAGGGGHAPPPYMNHGGTGRDQRDEHHDPLDRWGRRPQAPYPSQPPHHDDHHRPHGDLGWKMGM